MASALELVNEPELAIDPITPVVALAASERSGYSEDELRVFRIGHDEIERLAMTILNLPNYMRTGAVRQSTKLNIRPHVTEATFEDDIGQTPTFTITIHDDDWELLNLGALERVIDLNPGRIPHRWYRLQAINVNDSDITLTFETRNAVHLSNMVKRRKVNRKRITRAEFIKSLLRDVKKTRIGYHSPGLHKKQKIRKTVFPEQRERQRQRRKGFQKGFTTSDRITVGGSPASQNQRNNIEKVIAAGIDVNSPGLVIVLAVMTMMHETRAGDFQGADYYQGVFEQNYRDGWPATGDAYKDAKGNGKLGVKQGGFYGMAIPYWRAHRNSETLGQMAMHIQGALPSLNSANAGFDQQVDSHRSEAQHAVNAFSGDIDVGDPGDVGQPGFVNIKEPYFFTVGPPNGRKRENYLEAIYRMADEVNWRAFWVKDVLYYMSEEDLFKQKAVTRLRRNDDGVERVSFGWDRGKRVNEMLVTVRMERWIAPVGTVVTFDEGGPAEGRWLITNIRRSMFDELGEITLKKPMRERAEPANMPGRKSVEPRMSDRAFSGPGGNIVGGGGLEDVRAWMTPKQIMDRIVLPKARNHGMTQGQNPTSIARADPGSMHHGPPSYQWASDMSNGTSPTPQMDDLAAELIMAFNLPSLDLTRTRANGNSQWSEANHKGFDFECGYRTWEGGDHFNHVHFGVRRLSPAPSRPPGRPGYPGPQ